MEVLLLSLLRLIITSGESNCLWGRTMPALQSEPGLLSGGVSVPHQGLASGPEDIRFPSCHWYSEGAAWLLCLQPSGSDTWLLLDSSQPSQRTSRAGFSQSRLGDRMLTYRSSAPQSFRPDHRWPSRLFGVVGTEVAVSLQAPGKLFYLGTPCNYPSRIPRQGTAD